MEFSEPDYNSIQKLSRIAIWTSVGIILAGIERLIPTPIPWIKLGIANSAAVIVLFSLGTRAAFTVNILRVIAVALLFGTWSNPTFILSLGSAIIAVSFMAAVKFKWGNWLSPVGISTVGAWFHMLTQFVLASILIARHYSLMFIAGPSLVAAVITGMLTGWLAMIVLHRLPRRMLFQTDLER